MRAPGGRMRQSIPKSRLNLMLSLSKHEEPRMGYASSFDRLRMRSSSRRKISMSRAFVKETSESARPPERMVDDGPNLVTPEGMAQIEAHVARIEAALKTESNILLRETLERDLRYWSIRKASAEIVQPVPDGTVAFGSTRHHRTQRPPADIPHRRRGRSRSRARADQLPLAAGQCRSRRAGGRHYRGQ